MRGYFGIDSFEDFAVKALHAFSSEWRLESDEFVEHTAERPDIAAPVIGLVFPDLRGGVVRGAGLGVEEAFLGYL